MSEFSIIVHSRRPTRYSCIYCAMNQPDDGFSPQYIFPEDQLPAHISMHRMMGDRFAGTINVKVEMERYKALKRKHARDH